MFPIYYEKRESAKKPGSFFDVVFVDLGYRHHFLTFDRSVIAELLGISVADLYNVEPRYKVSIGSLDPSAVKV